MYSILVWSIIVTNHSDLQKKLMKIELSFIWWGVLNWNNTWYGVRISQYIRWMSLTKSIFFVDTQGIYNMKSRYNNFIHCNGNDIDEDLKILILSSNIWIDWFNYHKKYKFCQTHPTNILRYSHPISSIISIQNSSSNRTQFYFHQFFCKSEWLVFFWFLL